MKILIGLGIVMSAVVASVWMYSAPDVPTAPNVSADFVDVVFRSAVYVQGNQQVRTLKVDGTLVQYCEEPICARDSVGTTTVTLDPAVVASIQAVLAGVEESDIFEPDPYVLYEGVVTYEHVSNGKYLRHTATSEPIETVVRILDEQFASDVAENEQSP